jgi:hypothetical protein
VTIAPVPQLVSTASAYGFAVFTTVDPAVDGTGHCANGNPAVNCNIYDGKDFVWLNGGPKKGHFMFPDGTYFFAVLAPGGQQSPDDGAPGNLSDDFDAYTNRTFTVKNGKISAYSGTHWFDSGSHAQGAANDKPPFIRLSPYADTPNPGGVYKLAICSLANGYHVDSKGHPMHAKYCKYDSFKIVQAACQPKTETPDFTSVPAGQSVEGLGKVVPDLNIDALHTAVALAVGVQPMAYDADGPTGKVINGGMDPTGGFSDIQAHLNSQAHHYTFTFAPGVSVSDFSVHMLDFGDLNPTKSKTHFAAMTAYDASNTQVAQQTLSYTSNALSLPTTSNSYGNPQLTGDAIKAKPGQPGNWTWKVSGKGIVTVKLDFGAGFDPNLALDVLLFTTECPPCPTQ